MTEDHPGPERRHRTRSTKDPDEIERRFTAGSARMDRIEALIIENTKDTAEVLEIIRLGKSFFKVIGHLGSLIKWAAAVGAPMVAFYYAIKGGKS
jgi:hypothetical protein